VSDEQAATDALADMKDEGEPFVWGWMGAYLVSVDGRSKLGGVVVAAESREEAEGEIRRALESDSPPHIIVQLLVSATPLALYSKVYEHTDKHRELIDNIDAINKFTGE
jgi:hypothetical protein